MNKKYLAFCIVILLLVFGFLLQNNRNQVKQIYTVPKQDTQANVTLQPVNLTASFQIYTNGTKRIFTQAKYHNQSAEVYIEAADPSVVHVKAAGITWSDFFETLPMSLSKDCLVTGTKQTFCTTETQKLRFFLNDIENPNALENLINPNDELRVTFGE